MQLLTKEIEQQLPKLYSTEDTPLEEKKAIVKFFNPVGAGTWYGLEYDPDEKLFFGYVSIFGDCNDEFGYFSLEELENINLPFGMHIERDIYFEPTLLKNISNINL